MKLRGIDFGPVWGASGVQGFFGEGYWYHKPLRPFGLDFSGMTFVAKTTTIPPRAGNMPLNEDGFTPRERKPACIKINFRAGAALNAVGLSGPGAVALFYEGFRKGRWEKQGASFFLSFACVGATYATRKEELLQFIGACMFHGADRIIYDDVRVGIQLNFSCPNTEHGAPVWEELMEEITECLTLVGKLNLPLVPKISVLMPPRLAMRIAEHPACDAVCISNTLPWGALPEQIDWKGLFGSHGSPLAHLGGGGLSGAPLFPLVLRWVRDAQKLDFPKPICAGGGILTEENIRQLARFGVVGAVSIGSVAFLRPWRVQKLIKAAHRYIT